MRRLDNIDLRLLRVFVVLADAGGFADAQITLNLSQSTLSTHLSELETRIGARLCLRGQNKFRLTDAGQATYDAARKLFLDIDDFHARVATTNSGITGRLKIGVSEGVFTSPQLGMQKIIARLIKPDFEIFIDLFLGTPSELEQRLANGDRDIVIGPLTQKSAGVVYRPYFQEPHFLYCGKDHPLFKRPDNTITQAQIDASRLSVRGMLILSGHFIGFLPDHIAESWVQTGALRAIKPRTYNFKSQHNIAFREKDTDRPVIAAFLKCLPLS